MYYNFSVYHPLDKTSNGTGRGRATLLIIIWFSQFDLYHKMYGYFSCATAASNGISLRKSFMSIFISPLVSARKTYKSAA